MQSINKSKRRCNNKFSAEEHNCIRFIAASGSKKIIHSNRREREKEIFEDAAEERMQEDGLIYDCHRLFVC